MKIFGLKIVSAKQYDALKSAAIAAGAFIETEADRVVAALKQTSIGDAVVDSIEAIVSADLTGQQKFERVVSEIGPLVLKYVQGGGIKAALDDVDDIARQLVQSVFVSVKSTDFGKLVQQLLRLLGL